MLAPTPGHAAGSPYPRAAIRTGGPEHVDAGAAGRRGPSQVGQRNAVPADDVAVAVTDAGPPDDCTESVREVLLAEQLGTRSQIAALIRDFDTIVDASAAVATDDEHDPEGATIAFERAQVSALLSQARAHLDDLDRAVVRLGDGTYGRCESCGGEIAAARLGARPSARTCIDCAAARRR